MDSLNTLSIEHNNVIYRAQLIEKAVIECLEQEKKINKKEYLKIISPSKILFKTGLSSHFKFEELFLFPLLINKSKITEKKVRKLISDHSIIMKKFREFETIKNYTLSIQMMNDLMNSLSSHAKTEDEYFSSIHLSKEETTKIEEVALGLGFEIP